ncbi:MAG TPA: methionyl-tRNA formyltransferase, partial [Candidatus Saccharibacteria bacterium]|nr:methionyl-tRNA formyltransferase [Candidatus Saccharibacteria bacterium]
SIPVFQPQLLSELEAPLKQLGPATGVLVSYGKIIPQKIIDLFTPGIVNVHPSLLPAYRGPSPIEASIINGDTKTGVSIMQLSEKMDAGPVYSQATILLNGRETQASLYDSLAKLGIKELLNTLPRIISKQLEPAQQDETKATYTKLLTKADGVLDWQNPALHLEREVRGYNMWPRSRTRLLDHDVIVTKAHVESGAKGEPGTLDTDNESFITVNTSEARLRIDNLQPAGKKEMPIQAFLRGYSK